MELKAALAEKNTWVLDRRRHLLLRIKKIRLKREYVFVERVLFSPVGLGWAISRL